jgi:glycosyltransferase involved in cell wall biosynthesis
VSGPVELRHCCHVVVGPSGHGVVRHGLRLARASGSPLVHVAAPDAAVVLPASTRVVHLHVTDKLFGRSPAEAAAACARLVQRLDAPVVIGLHDVPLGDADDVAKGRVEAYRSFASIADVLVVASSAEARRLREFAAGADAAVLPLPVPVGRPHRRGVTDGRLGVLGFVYPGKGHPTVIDAAAMVGADVVAVGACSPGHDDLAPSLRERAARRGIELEITGAVPSARFVAQATTIAVPVVPSTRPAASASLMSWIGAGRRPLVAANEHTVEVAERLGAHLQLFDGTADSLAGAAAAALAEPAVTWSHRAIPREATLPGIVERLGRLLAHVHERVA